MENRFNYSFVDEFILSLNVVMENFRFPFFLHQTSLIFLHVFREVSQFVDLMETFNYM